MEKGVFGYILLPFQPGEANLMVARALQSAPISTPHTEPTTENLRSLQAVEADHILNALRVCKNNQAKAAKILGIGRNTLWRKLKKIEATRRDE
ncbi:MAG: helix-turn-helix domain-containing protein [Candidatus Hydrogenedentes bacterium]|nr:helix-turn-helix domain-containing protein [Candidatus Hydrogenedentota bacterium]